MLGKRLEVSALRADGTEFPVELSITRLPTDGPPVFTGFPTRQYRPQAG
jgi:hypothetical protein